MFANCSQIIEKGVTISRNSLNSCDSGGIQTHNLLIRSQMLYSVELRNRCSLKASAKVRRFAEIAKSFWYFFRKKMIFRCISLYFKLLSPYSSTFRCGKLMWYFTASTLTMTTLRKLATTVISMPRLHHIHTW